MKRALSLMLSILTVLTLFAGCAAKPADPQPAGPADPGADPAGTNEPAPAADSSRRATNEIVVGI